MAAFLVSTLLAFVGVIALVTALAVIIAGLIVLIIARKGDRPVQLTPRSAAVNVIALGCLVGWQAFDVLAGLTL
jgi:hypothetical protein